MAWDGRPSPARNPTAGYSRGPGRPRSLGHVGKAVLRGGLPPDRLATARDLLAAGHNHSDVARTLHVARTTLYRALTTDEAESPPSRSC